MIEEANPLLTEGDVTPLVSVVLPVYNGEKYLMEAINSILAQTFENFELIIIDDGSADNSRQILRSYERLDPRVRVLVRENRGLVTTLNESIDMARGEWIARMDQDDIALPHRLERQLKWLKTSQADIAGSWVQRFGTSDKRVLKLCQTDEAIKMEMLFCSPFAHPAVMMRTELVKQLRYDITCEKAEDYDLWERAAEAGWKMTNVQEVLLLYRVHAAQISTKTALQQQLVSLQIQRRYWEHVCKLNRLSRQGIEDVLKTRVHSESRPDMDLVDAMFVELLQRSHGEAREVIIKHLTRLYCRVAADCPDIVLRWEKFFSNLRWHESLPTKISLWVLSQFHIQIDSKMLKQLKKFYVSRLAR